MRTLALVLAAPLAGSLVPRATPLRRRSATRAAPTMLVGAPAPSDAFAKVASDAGAAASFFANSGPKVGELTQRGVERLPPTVRAKIGELHVARREAAVEGAAAASRRRQVAGAASLASDKVVSALVAARSTRKTKPTKSRWRSSLSKMTILC